MSDDSTVMNIARKLYELNPDTQPWDGDNFTFDEAMRRGEYRAPLAVKQAWAILNPVLDAIVAIQGELSCDFDCSYCHMDEYDD